MKKTNRKRERKRTRPRTPKGGYTDRPSSPKGKITVDRYAYEKGLK